MTERKKMNPKYLIIDERMRNIEKQKLEKMGYYLIEIKKSPNVYEEISSHVDIFACKIGDKIIVEPSVYEDISKKISVEKGNACVLSKYPEDVKYNVCIIGKKSNT